MEEINEEKYQLYTIDDNLYCIDNETDNIYRIDFNKAENDTSEENDDLNQDDSDEDDSDEDEPEDNSEKKPKKPKKDGSGEGKRVNRGRGGCKETEEKGKGKEESEEEKDHLDENKDEEHDVSDPNLNKNLKNAIKNKTKGGCDMDFENKETSETKPDGSEAMKERRITQCMEESGKSREACTKEVRKKMHETNAEVVNPEDMKVEETIEVIEEKKDTVEICPEELDFLKKQAEELKTLKAEKEEVDNELKSFKADFLKFKKKIDDKETSEKEVKRQEVIKRISYDFDIPEEKLNEKTIEQLLEHEEILELALKRDSKEEVEDFGEEEDFKEISDRIHKKYYLEV